MVLKDKLTVLVTSCDKYEDTWHPFFRLFDVYGEELKSCDILLNTESKSYQYEGLNIITKQLYKDKQVPWGERIREHVRHIQTPYFLLFLDDFFIREKVDIEFIKMLIDRMDKDESVATFNLQPLLGSDSVDDKYPEFTYSAPEVEYRINAQTAIWRTEEFNNTILDIESPWEWETYGNMRNALIYDKKIYHLAKNINEPINTSFKYNVLDGTNNIYGVFRGKWCVQDVDPIFKEHGINIDYSIRGELKLNEKSFKNTLLYKTLFKIAYPFRKKRLQAINKVYEMKNQETYDRLVTPYIKGNNGKV